MTIQQEHLTALKTFGYTEREARFLYIIAVHSGYFTQAHLRQFSGNRSGRTVHAFIKRALAQEHVKESKYQNNARVYQLTYKPMYEAIGRANVRNRREHSFDFIKTKLACLDFIIAHPQHNYFEGEADKVEYFQNHFKIRPQEMPGKTYAGANRVPDTIRYFVDKFPMFLDTARLGEPLPTLTYVDPGIGHLSDFSTHLNTYSDFMKRLPYFAFVYAGPRTAFFSKAETIFRAVLDPQTGKLSSQLGRYFLLRAAWEAKRYETLNNTDLEFLNHAKQCFSGEPFESTFKKWQSGQINEKGLIAEIENRPASKQEAQFKTCLLARDYSSFGQNSKVTGKPC
jgi:hypothetical protein